MLSNSQMKTVRALKTKMNRQRRGLCLVEGEKLVKEAGRFVEFEFRREDTPEFDELVSTESPQPVAAVARVPEWNLADLESRPTVVILDGVQDPGNVGTIMRLCLGFRASLLLVDSADVTNPKVIRSSAGALFSLPWVRMGRLEAEKYLKSEGDRPALRLERRSGSTALAKLTDLPESLCLIAGSEGSGIRMKAVGDSVHIEHEPELDSLNVAQAIGIALYSRYLHP